MLQVQVSSYMDLASFYQKQAAKYYQIGQLMTMDANKIYYQKMSAEYYKLARDVMEIS